MESRLVNTVSSMGTPSHLWAGAPIQRHLVIIACLHLGSASISIHPPVVDIPDPSIHITASLFASSCCHDCRIRGCPAHTHMMTAAIMLMHDESSHNPKCFYSLQTRVWGSLTRRPRIRRRRNDKKKIGLTWRARYVCTAPPPLYTPISSSTTRSSGATTQSCSSLHTGAATKRPIILPMP
jgi:hypothetical protein